MATAIRSTITIARRAAVPQAFTYHGPKAKPMPERGQECDGVRLVDNWRNQDHPVNYPRPG